jgi:hypothetical protein
MGRNDRGCGFGLRVTLHGWQQPSLTTPDIKWLGLRPSDLDKYQ